MQNPYSTWMIRKGQKCEVEALQFTDGGMADGARPSLSTFLIPPTDRDDLGIMLNSLGGFEIGVELGVQRGQHSKFLLTHWAACKKYYMVDLWAQQDNYKDVGDEWGYRITVVITGVTVFYILVMQWGCTD